jgi:hypothetical protein
VNQGRQILQGILYALDCFIEWKDHEIGKYRGGINDIIDNDFSYLRVIFG